MPSGLTSTALSSAYSPAKLSLRLPLGPRPFALRLSPPTTDCPEDSGELPGPSCAWQRAPWNQGAAVAVARREVMRGRAERTGRSVQPGRFRELRTERSIFLFQVSSFAENAGLFRCSSNK